MEKNILNSFIDKRYSIKKKLIIKVLKRVGFGYKDFKFLRVRILFSFTGIISGSTRSKKTSNSKNNK